MGLHSHISAAYQLPASLAVPVPSRLRRFQPAIGKHRVLCREASRSVPSTACTFIALRKLSIAPRKGVVTQAVETAAVESESSLPDVTKLTVAQLKELCKERGLPVSGKKAELQARLLGGAPPPPPPEETGPYAGLTAAGLKELLKERGLSTTGRKAELVEKLVANDNGELTPEMEEAARKEKLKGNGRRKANRDPNKPLILSSRNRSTKGLTKVQVKILEREAEMREAMVQEAAEAANDGAALAEEDAMVEAQQEHEVLVSWNKGAENTPRRSVLAASEGGITEDPPRAILRKQNTEIEHYLLNMLDTGDEVVVAYQLKETMIARATTQSTTDPMLVEARVMSKKVRGTDPRTGRMKNRTVRYPHGNLRISCYMDDELFKHIESMGVQWCRPKGDKEWTPGSTAKGTSMPRQLTHEEFAETEAWLAEQATEDEAAPVNLETSLDFLDAGLVRKIAVKSGRVSKTAAKKAARRENAEILGTELPQEAEEARTFERRGGWDDGGWGDQGESGMGRGRGGREQWEPRGGRGQGRESGGRRGGQFDNRDEKRYDDRNSWGEYNDGENSQGWFDGDNNNWTRGRNEDFDGPAENFRVNGVTDDGRSTWVSHGNTWNQWDDDPDDDSAGKKPKGRGAGGASEADKQWAAFDDDKNWEWLDGEAEGDGSSAQGSSGKGASARRDIMDDWLGDDDVGDNDTWAPEGDSRAKDPSPAGGARAGGAKGWAGTGDDAWPKEGFADWGDEQHGGVKGWRNNEAQKSSSSESGAWGNMNIWDDVDLPMSSDSPSGGFGMDKGNSPKDNDQWSKWNDGEGRPQGRGQQQQQQQKRRHRGGSEWDDGPDAFWTDGAFGDGSRDSDDVGRWLDDLEDSPVKGASRGMANRDAAGSFGGDGMGSELSKASQGQELEPGSKIDVVSGPFSNFKGKVLQSKRNGAVQVRLDIFGLDTDVEVNAVDCQVKP